MQGLCRAKPEQTRRQRVRQSAKAFHRKADKASHFAYKYDIDKKDRENAVMNHVKKIDDLYA